MSYTPGRTGCIAESSGPAAPPIRPAARRVSPCMSTTSSPAAGAAKPPSLTVYYDGACPVCSREVAFYRRRDGAAGIDWIDAASCDAADLGPGLVRDRALGRLHVRHADGRLASGADAFVAIWRRLPVFRPLAWLFALPPLTRGLEAVYGLFLRWRNRRRRGH